ncbi:hypothetical protein POVCU2_0035270 [Plasmodium ovale curtisi]|uniref:Uncharacterized protein n=1 Tax=Plasmodium ovale curtisi TaxID=864141 RepID=A0A1A8W2D2_PLAOA|nr:hypothetical protein POVCU2_0035270 [Plasmodium ovale curtisi]SBS96455.1 hypothetical protein POVCU1_032520 [Plasmodium ovale curtisi]
MGIYAHRNENFRANHKGNKGINPGSGLGPSSSRLASHIQRGNKFPPKEEEISHQKAKCKYMTIHGKTLHLLPICNF